MLFRKKIQEINSGICAEFTKIGGSFFRQWIGAACCLKSWLCRGFKLFNNETVSCTGAPGRDDRSAEDLQADQKRVIEAAAGGAIAI